MSKRSVSVGQTLIPSVQEYGSMRSPSSQLINQMQNTDIVARTGNIAQDEPKTRRLERVRLQKCQRRIAHTPFSLPVRFECECGFALRRYHPGSTTEVGRPRMTLKIPSNPAIISTKITS